MDFDVLIIGGGVAGMQCTLVIGSAKDKPFAQSKSIGLIAHQRSSHLQNALFKNTLGLPPGTMGKEILSNGLNQIKEQYKHVTLIEKEKVGQIEFLSVGFRVLTNKNLYTARIVVLALNYSKPFTIGGLEEYILPHQKANPSKDRIQLKNLDHLIRDNLYCCGTIAGHRSQFSIAAGSGAAVATDILTRWNGGSHTKVHDKI